MSSWKVIWHLRTLCSAEPMNGFHREGYSVQWSGHYVLNAEVSGFQVGIQNLTMQTAWHLLLCPLLLIFIVLWNEFGLGFSLEWFHLIYWFHSLLRTEKCMNGPRPLFSEWLPSILYFFSFNASMDFPTLHCFQSSLLNHSGSFFVVRYSYNALNSGDVVGIDTNEKQWKLGV